MKDLQASLTKKIILVGDSGCGKTCLLSSYLQGGNLPNKTYVPTIFEVYNMDVVMQNTKCKFSIHDTAGLEAYDRLRPLSYPDTDMVVICFSVTDPDSLQNVIDKWVPEIKNFCPGTPFVLVGTKCDLRDDVRTVSTLKRAKQLPVTTEQARRIAKQIKALKYIECSATQGFNTQRVFDTAMTKTVKSKPSLAATLNLLFSCVKRHANKSIVHDPARESLIQ